jgi:uncharacterized membrane protein YraQ (UPF0718 family)
MSSFAFLADRKWLGSLLREAFNREFWGFAAAAGVLGAACFWLRGADVMIAALESDGGMLLRLLPRVLVALSIASLIWVMLPRDRISKLAGQNTGIGGLIIATVAGMVTPGGPSSAYPLLAVLGAAGADRGALVAYITAWATLGMQRVLVWDVPFMGAEFAILRTLISLPLPIVAGLIARKLPLVLNLRTPKPGDPDPETQP